MDKSRFIAMLEYYAKVIPESHYMVGKKIGSRRVRLDPSKKLYNEPLVGKLTVKYLEQAWPSLFADRLEKENNILGFKDTRSRSINEAQEQLGLTDEQIALFAVCCEWFRVPNYPGAILRFDPIGQNFYCLVGLEALV